jgi:hypothetical protein
MLKHTAASGPLALFFATFRRCNGEVRVNRLLPASASPLRDVVRNQSSEHIKLFLVHSHLRLKDIGRCWSVLSMRCCEPPNTTV